MGKRKLHNHTFYQCDWTGYPMRFSNCYMPTWQGDKLIKRGSYCNWESVLAHAYHMYDVEKSIEYEELQRILEHLHEIMGCIPDHKQYHFTFLEHFKEDATYWQPVTDVPRNWSMDEFHKQCCKTVDAVIAVKITSEGDVFDIIAEPTDGKLDFAKYIDRPYMLTQHTVQQFQSMRKGKLPKDRELTVFYWPFKNGLPLNTIASKVFKMQIYGDILLVQQTKESTFKSRERYVNFTKQLFEDLFTKKKKKVVDDNAFTPAEFKMMKDTMQSSLNGYEASISSSAQRPQDIAKAASMPPSSGKELAEVAQFLGHVPPPKKRKRQPETKDEEVVTPGELEAV